MFRFYRQLLISFPFYQYLPIWQLVYQLFNNIFSVLVFLSQFVTKSLINTHNLQCNKICRRTNSRVHSPETLIEINLQRNFEVHKCANIFPKSLVDNCNTLISDSHSSNNECCKVLQQFYNRVPQETKVFKMIWPSLNQQTVLAPEHNSTQQQS